MSIPILRMTAFSLGCRILSPNRNVRVLVLGQLMECRYGTSVHAFRAPNKRVMVSLCMTFMKSGPVEERCPPEVADNS